MTTPKSLGRIYRSKKSKIALDTAPWGKELKGRARYEPFRFQRVAISVVGMSETLSSGPLVTAHVRAPA